MENYFGLLIAVLILLTVVLTAILVVIVYMVFFKKEDRPVQASPTTDEVDTPQLKASAKKQIIDTPILTT